MYSSCQHYSFIGSRVEGALSEYMLIDPKNLIKLPDDEEIRKYTLLEPLTVALHAISQTSIKFGETAVIFGAGTIGLLIMQILRNLAYHDLIMVDIDNFKLNLAKKLGSLHNINLTHESLDQYIKENIGSTGINVVFEVSGATAAKQNAIHITQPGGSIILIGTPQNDVVFDGPTFELITRKELKLIGSWMSYSDPFPGSEWRAGIQILKSNLLDIEFLITHSYKLDEIETAFNMILKNTEKHCKVIINIW
jgi:threonine dehydrogenase-like Zn-dependent dehydrogenase